MERDKDEMQRLTEMLNDPNAEFQVHQELDFEQKFEITFDFLLTKTFKDDDEEAMEQEEEDPNLIQNEVEIEATKETEKMEEQFFYIKIGKC